MASIGTTIGANPTSALAQATNATGTINYSGLQPGQYFDTNGNIAGSSAQTPWQTGTSSAGTVSPIRTDSSGNPITSIASLVNKQPSQLGVSTTTLSNTNKMNQVPSLIGNLNNLSQKGITTNASGVPQYSNGTLVPQSPDNSQTPESAAPQATYTDANGMERNADGTQAPIPQGATYNGQGGYTLDGKTYAPPITDTSYQDKQTNDLLDQMKATTDANTADQIANIQQQFALRKQQQTQTNAGQQAGITNALLMGGVTGQGSSAQYAPISSQNIISQQETYGIQQLAQLDTQENTAIAAAKQAQQTGDFALLDKQLALIDNQRQEKVDAATKLNDQIAAQNKVLSDQTKQSNIDNSIANLYSQGVTDPSQILTQLNASGLNITSDQVANAIKNIANTNGVDVSNLDQTTQEFYKLKSEPGGLPVSILHLGSTAEQLVAYIKMKNEASNAGTTLGKAVDTTGATGTTALANAIISKESGGDYSAVNKDSGALGKYQIMPSNLAAYAVGADGQPLTDSPADQKYFLDNPDVQDNAFNALMSDLSTKYNGDPAKIAAAYYGGDGAVQVLGTPAGDKPQPGGYPSVNDYVKSVTANLNVAPGTTGSPQIDSSAAGYSSTALSSAGGLTQAAVDKAALQYATTGVMPSVGLGSTGSAAAKRNAIQNRAAELDTNGQITANKAKLTGLTNSLTEQTEYQNTIERSVNTVDDNLNILQGLIDKVNKSSSPKVNDIINAVNSKYLGSGDLAAFNAALQTVRTEYSTILGRGSPTDQTRTEASTLIPNDITEPQLQEVLDTLKTEGVNIKTDADSQVSSIQGQINNIIGGGNLYASGNNGNSSSISSLGGSNANDFLNNNLPGSDGTLDWSKAK